MLMLTILTILTVHVVIIVLGNEQWRNNALLERSLFWLLGDLDFLFFFHFLICLFCFVFIYLFIFYFFYFLLFFLLVDFVCLFVLAKSYRK